MSSSDPFPPADVSAAATTARHPWFWLAVIALSLSVWGFVDVYHRGKVDPLDASLHKTDLTVYTEAGAAFFDGRQPYEVTNPRGWGYLYLPLFAMLLAPLHSLQGEWQVTVWFFISVATLAGCYFESVRLARLAAGSQSVSKLFPPWIIRAAVATVALPTFNCLQRGQIGVLQLYLLLLGLRLGLEAGNRFRGQFLAGAALAIPIGLKLTPALPVACYWLQRLGGAIVWPRRPALGHETADAATTVEHGGAASGLVARSERRWAFVPSRLLAAAASGAGVCACLLVWTLIVPAALVGWQANLRHLGQWYELVGSKTKQQTYDRFAGDSYSVRNQSLSNALHHLGNWTAYQFAGGPYDEPFENEGTFIPEFVTDTLPFEIFIRGSQLAVIAIAAWLSWRGARTDDHAWRIAAFGLACVAMLIASPIARVHYFVSLMPAMLFAPAVLLRAGRTRAAAWLAWTPLALVLAHYVLMRIVGRVGLLGIGITIWFICGSVMLGRMIPEREDAASPSLPASRQASVRSGKVRSRSSSAPQLTA